MWAQVSYTTEAVYRTQILKDRGLHSSQRLTRMLRAQFTNVDEIVEGIIHKD